jgi:hypothetical protein
MRPLARFTALQPVLVLASEVILCSAAARSNFDNFFAAFEVMDVSKKKGLTAAEMQQGFSKVRRAK